MYLYESRLCMVLHVPDSTLCIQAMPDFMLNQNAVLGDECTWRHGKTPNYAAANAKFAKGRHFCLLGLVQCFRATNQSLYINLLALKQAYMAARKQSVCHWQHSLASGSRWQ